MTTIMIRATLPWDERPEDAKRSKRFTIIALAIGLLAAVIVPNVKLPKIERAAADVDAERIARVVQQRKIELPPPLPPAKKLEEKKKIEEKNKPDEKKKPDVTEKVKPTEVEPVAKSKPMDIKDGSAGKGKGKASDKEIGDAKAKASKIAQESGINDALASLRDFDTVATSKNPSTGGGLQKNSGEPVGTSRNMITSRAGTSSGGLAYNGPASSGFGGGVAGGKGGKGDFSLGGKGTKNMKGGLIAGGGGGGGGGGDGAAGGRGDGSGKTRGEGGIGKRTTEDIRKVFDQNGGRLNNAYQRALKDDPSMEGTVRLKLSIDPSGKVLSCEIASSDLNNAELEAKIVSLVKGFNFGEDNVETWKGTYPVNFYPN